MEPVNAGHFYDFLDFQEVFKELVEGLRIMQIKHDNAFCHPFRGIQVKRPDINIMFFRDHFGNFPDKTFFINALYLDPGQEPDGFLIFPFGLYDPFSIFGHQVYSIRAVCPVDLDRAVLIKEPNDVVTGYGAAASGQDIFDLCYVIAEHE